MHDEFVHVPVGYAQARYGLFNLESANPPLIRMIFGYPIRYYSPILYWGEKLPTIDYLPYSYMFQADNAALYHTMIVTSRFVVLALSLLLAYLVYRWAREEYGDRAGLFALVLCLFNPNILAHGTAATLDIGLALSWLGVLYCLKKYMDHPTWFRLILIGILLGLAETAKFTSLLLFLIIPLILLLDSDFQKKITSKKFIFHAMTVLVICLVVMNSVYSFHRSFTPLGEYKFRFALFQQVGSLIPASTPIPLPFYYLSGVDNQLTETAKYPSYLNGHFSYTGFWSYYLEAFVIKNPVAFLIFLGWVLYLLFLTVKGGVGKFGRERPPTFPTLRKLSRSELIWMMSAGILILFFSYSRMKNIGLRYILPAFPFLFMLCGKVISQRWDKKILLSLLLVWYIGSTLYVCPQYLGYYNELVGGSGNGYKYLLDSNTDWGQDFIRLKAYMTKHGMQKIWFAPSVPGDPKIYGINFEHAPEEPVSGIVAISVNVDPYRGFRGPDPTKRERYGWLNQYPPTARIGSSIFIYDVP